MQISIPPGEYLLNKTIYLPKSVRLVGERNPVERAAAAAKNQMLEILGIDFAKQCLITRPARVVPVAATVKKRATSLPAKHFRTRRRLRND
jgi:hypothetical protein